MVAHLYARQNSLACQESRDITAAVSWECSLTESIDSKRTVSLAQQCFFGDFTKVCCTRRKDIQGCALQSYLQEQNTENKVSEHRHVLVTLWG